MTGGILGPSSLGWPGWAPAALCHPLGARSCDCWGWDGVSEEWALALMGARAVVLPGFLGEGDAITKAIQDARQLLHGHSGAMEGSLTNAYRKVRKAHRVVTVPFSDPTVGSQSWVSILAESLELVPESPLSCRTTLGLILPQ